MKITKEKLKQLIKEEYASIAGEDTKLENVEEPGFGASGEPPPVNPLEFKDAIKSLQDAATAHDGTIHFITAFLEKKFPEFSGKLRGLEENK